MNKRNGLANIEMFLLTILCVEKEDIYPTIIKDSHMFYVAVTYY